MQTGLPVHVLRNATPAQLEQAAAHNHRELFCLNAIIRNGEVKTADGITWTFAGTGMGAEIVFPALTDENAGSALDEVMAYYRTHTPSQIGCWSLAPAQPAQLGARLLARGFQPGWQPCWMALDLQHIQPVNSRVNGLSIAPDMDTNLAAIKGLPYGDDNGYMSQALLHAYPQQVKRFVARTGETIVGQCCLFLTNGEYGVAGIYNVGVLPAYRNKGIGKALVNAAVTDARRQGYAYALLNANDMGRPVYQQLGFEIVGYGLTWWLMNKTCITHPPAPDRVAIAEAAACGDITALENAGSRFSPAMLNEPLPNKMTLVQLAAHCQQPAAAEWLVKKGADISVMDAWELGWKKRAAELLQNNPEEVNRRYYDWNGTLMHIAAEKNDIELARLALAAHADLTLLDTQHHGSALGWAMFFKRDAIIKLIEENMKQSQATKDQ